jgi:hypothetical protein
VSTDSATETESGHQHAGQHVRGVAAVAVDAGEEQHPGGREGEGGSHGDPQAGVTDEMAADVRAQADDHGHRQERQAGLQRAGAQHLLEVHRGEQERAEQDGGRGQHHREATADPALGQPRDVEEGRAGVALQGGEHREPGEARKTETERLDRGPAGVGGLGEGVDERAEARRGDEGAAEVEAAPPRARDVRRNHLDGGGRDTDAHGEVDEEDGPPVDDLGQRAAQQHADGGAGAADGSPHAERLRAVRPAERGGDDRQGGRRQHGRAETLGGARGEEHRFTRGQSREERGDGEDAEAGEEHPTTTEQIGGASPEQQEAAEDERVGRHRPPQVVPADGEVVGEVGKRHVHGRDVEDDHELRQGEQRQQGHPGALAGPMPAGAIVAGQSLRVLGSSVAGEAEPVGVGSVHDSNRTRTVVSEL